jgi:hypothetical protein
MKTLKSSPEAGPKRPDGRGGARKGAGRPLGATIANGAKMPAASSEKMALLALWKAEVGRQFPDLVAAQIASARGITHMMARDDAGRWQSVTDPAQMAERLNAGAEYYRLTAVAPSAPMMTGVMDRMFGSPKASIELEVTQAPEEMTDMELAACLVALLDKLKKPDAPQ